VRRGRSFMAVFSHTVGLELRCAHRMSNNRCAPSPNNQASSNAVEFGFGLGFGFGFGFGLGLGFGFGFGVRVRG
jgi:hypothetical protein